MCNKVIFLDNHISVPLLLILSLLSNNKKKGYIMHLYGNCFNPTCYRAEFCLMDIHFQCKENTYNFQYEKLITDVLVRSIC